MLFEIPILVSFESSKTKKTLAPTVLSRFAVEIVSFKTPESASKACCLDKSIAQLLLDA